MCRNTIIYKTLGFPGGSVTGKESAAIQETQFSSCLRKSPWRRRCQPTPVFLPGKSPGQRSLAGYSPLGRKSRTQLSDLTTNHHHHGWEIKLFPSFCYCKNTIMNILVQFSSVTQSCLTLCNPMDCSTPGLPAHHQLLEFTQTHVH